MEDARIPDIVEMVKLLFPVVFLYGVQDDPLAKCILRDGHPFYLQHTEDLFKNDHAGNDNIRSCRIKPVDPGAIVRVVLFENQFCHLGNLFARKSEIVNGRFPILIPPQSDDLGDTRDRS